MSDEKIEVVRERIKHDAECAPGLGHLLVNIAENGYKQQELETMLHTVRALRIGHRPEYAEEQLQAAYARGADKIIRLAITQKNIAHREKKNGSGFYHT